MLQRQVPAVPATSLHLRLIAPLWAIATACLVMQAVGCTHPGSERTAFPPQPRAVEKQAAPGAGQPSRLEQLDRTKAVEKKSPATREKKSAVPTEKSPEKKLESTGESGTSTDTLTPPPPLKPPTFGGAGG